MNLEIYNKQIPKEALIIIDELEKAGYEAYIVGGCVRDMLMQREPNDWDITTSAKPEQVKNTFKRTYDTGIEHGTVTVILEKEHYEVTTYRIEKEYKDFRRPSGVSFVEEITLDLSRRDFTMNAIAYHPTRGFVDPYRGIEDIAGKRIVSVRSAEERFREDALRILRAVRFAAQLGFEIAADTIKGIKHCKELLAYISKERMREEFLKICLSERPSYIHVLHELQLLPYIMPEFDLAYETKQNHPHTIYNVAEHTIVAMEQSPKDKVIRLALLLHDIGKPYTKTTDIKGIDHFYNHPKVGAKLAQKILKDLRWDNNTIKEVSLLVTYHDYHIGKKIDKILIKQILGCMGEVLFDKLLCVQWADARAQNLNELSRKEEQINLAKELKKQIIENEECFSLKQLVINGADLLSIGVPKGTRIGEELNKVLEHVCIYPEDNKKEILLSIIKLTNLS